MSRRVPSLLTALLLLAASAAAEVPHTANPEMPRDGIQVLATAEAWRRGGEDDDLFFGALRTVQLGPDGNVYALDTQLAQVHVFDTEGSFVHSLSREGEGPGEVRRPEDIVFFPDGSLGIAQYINGRIVRLAADGTPLATVMPPRDSGGGGMSAIRRVRCRAGTLVVNGVRMKQVDDGMLREQYLLRCDEDANVLAAYLVRAVPSNLMRDGWIERNNYFPSHERWDIDAQGRVLAATERNDYRVTVFAADGTPLRSFGRAAEAWRRTDAEKQEIRDSLVVLRDGERVRVEVEVEDREAAIAELHAMPGGETWVLPSAGIHGQPAGIMLTYDVFDADGVFVRQVRVACAGDPDEDRLFLLEDGTLALVTGAVQARRNAFGGSRAEDPGGVAEHALVLLRS